MNMAPRVLTTLENFDKKKNRFTDVVELSLKLKRNLKFEIESL